MSTAVFPNHNLKVDMILFKQLSQEIDHSVNIVTDTGILTNSTDS